MKHNARTIAALIIDDVFTRNRSLADCSTPLLEKLTDLRERKLAQELSYGVLRWDLQLRAILAPFLHKPLKSRDSIIMALLLIGAYQIRQMRTPEYAAVSSTVEAARYFGRPWATSLLNGILRNLTRQDDVLSKIINQSETIKYSHPEWMLRRLQKDWPEDWPTILKNNNRPPELALRVNQRKISREDYLLKLKNEGIPAIASRLSGQGIMPSHSVNPALLPGFTQGEVSVQGIAAQQAVYLLDLKPGCLVLDACAAPGGKTAHILETEPELTHMIAIDTTSKRINLLESTLRRLELLSEKVEIIDCDITCIKKWWNGQHFDRILLDAPCSATGVIRKHPDIKYHRTEEDIDLLVEKQREMLIALWPLLASGGRLVYVTCSTFRQENQEQISWFLSQQQDARELPIDAPWGRRVEPGRQILPGEEGMDGFYYACLVKE